MKNWAFNVLLALPIAVASQAMLSLLVIMTDPDGDRLGQHISYVIIAVQVAIFAIATLHLAKFQSIRRKVESVLIWAGLVLVATIPLMLGIIMIEASIDTSPDKGGAVAAFFMLIIFGGAYGGLGVILLIIGFLQRWSRREAERTAGI